MTKNNEIKGGMTREAALAMAMPLAKKSVARWGRLAREAGVEDDALGAAYEGLLKAWAGFKGDSAEDWMRYARCWSDEMAKREINKLRSVVSTNYTRRRIATDDSMVVATEDGWAYRDEPSDENLQEQVENRELLAQAAARLQQAAEGLKGPAAVMASDLIARIMAGDDGESVATIAQRHGFTPVSAYRVENTLRAALA